LGVVENELGQVLSFLQGTGLEGAFRCDGCHDARLCLESKDTRSLFLDSELESSFSDFEYTAVGQPKVPIARDRWDRRPDFYIFLFWVYAMEERLS
jgi:hypothetical protein